MSLVRDLNREYSSISGATLRYDLFLPEGEGPFPLVACIHGGGWISGDRCDMHEVAKILAQDGFAAACVQYRLAPLHPFPSPVEDVRAFIRHIRTEAADLPVDSSRIGSLGISAGGHLAQMLGVGPAESRVHAVVNICGISDVSDPRSRHYPIAWSFLDQFMGGVPYEGNEELFRQASPLHQVDENAAPSLLIHGEVDDIVPVEQSRSLAEAFERHGVAVRLELFPFEGHSFSLDAWPRIDALSREFLTERLLG
jgi:acetyl esterase/lipase